MLTASELAGMRNVTADALPDTAIIQTQAYASDGGGGGTTTWTASGTVDCRLAPILALGESERQVGGRISADAQLIATLPFDAVVSTNSRLVISGVNYTVEAIRDRSWELTTRVEVVKEV